MIQKVIFWPLSDGSAAVVEAPVAAAPPVSLVLLSLLSELPQAPRATATRIAAIAVQTSAKLRRTMLLLFVRTHD
jgi:hypothetical protein